MATHPMGARLTTRGWTRCPLARPARRRPSGPVRVAACPHRQKRTEPTHHNDSGFSAGVFEGEKAGLSAALVAGDRPRRQWACRHASEQYCRSFRDGSNGVEQWAQVPHPPGRSATLSHRFRRRRYANASLRHRSPQYRAWGRLPQIVALQYWHFCSGTIVESSTASRNDAAILSVWASQDGLFGEQRTAFAWLLHACQPRSRPSSAAEDRALHGTRMRHSRRRYIRRDVAVPIP